MAELAAIILLIAGLILIQALIGGRGLLFSLPAYGVLGAGALLGVISWPRLKTSPDLFCLGTTAIFGGYIIFRALFSPGYFARADLFSILAALAVYGLTITVASSSSVRLGIFSSLLTFGLAHVLVGLIQFSRADNFMLIPFLQRVDYGERASGFFVCPNHLAGLLEVLGIFGLSLTCFTRWPMWSKLLIGYATVACYGGVLITGSRGGYLSSVVSLLAFGVASFFVVHAAKPKSWPKFAATGLLALTGIIFSGWFLIHQSGFLDARAKNLIDINNVRVVLWRAALEQWELQPFLGTGAGSYRYYGRKFRTAEMQNDPIDVHNDYLHLLCEYGIVGAVAFFLFFCAHLRKGWQTLNRLGAASTNRGGALRSNRLALQLGAWGAIAAYVVHSVVDFNLHIPANAMLMALVFGIVAKPTGSRTSETVYPLSTSVPLLTAALLGLILLVQSVRLLPGEYFAEQSRVALRDENPEASVEFAQRALVHERQNPEVFFYLGRGWMALAHRAEEGENRSAYYEKSVSAFQEAHRLAPLDGTYPLNLAFAYDEMGLFEEADRAFELARVRDPRSTSVAELYRAHLHSWQKVEPSPN